MWGPVKPFACKAMLRPKQLLPLCKGARSWLVATTYGTRTGDQPGSPHGLPNPDDQDGKYERPPYISKPALGQAEKLSSPAKPAEPSAPGRETAALQPPFCNASIPGIYLKETFTKCAGLDGTASADHSEGKPSQRTGNSAGASFNEPSAEPSTLQKVGLAAISGLCGLETGVFPSAGNGSSHGRIPRERHGAAGVRNTAAVIFEKEGFGSHNEVPRSNPSSTTSELELQSASAGRAAASCLSTAGSTHRSSGSGSTLQNTGGTSRFECQSHIRQTRPSSQQAPPPSPWSSIGGKVGQTSPAVLPRQLSVAGSATSFPRVEGQRWNGGAARGGHHGMMQVGSRRHTHKAATESRAAVGEVVDHVCNILRQLNWNSDTLEELSHVNTKLSAFHINEVLKHQKEAGLALKFFDWAKGQTGYKHDVCTYTTMIGILGRTRNFEACTRLLEEMRREGCEPSVVTYNRMIHSYGRANYLGEALRIFHQMQEVGCTPDRVTYCTLVDLHSKAGFHDIAMDMYQQMLQAGFQPDTFTYSVIIHCLGKAGKVTAAYKLFQEMIDRGYTPNLVTYNIVIDLQAKAGNPHMAMKLYNDMQDAGFQPDKVTYSIMMEVLGQAGHIDEAERVFFEMEQAGWTPDAPMYGSMVDLWGKVGNADKAWEWYKKMLDSGLTANVQTSNALLGAYLRVQRYDAAHEVVESMCAWGMFPTLQTYTILLSCCTGSEQNEQVMGLMASTSHPAHNFVCTLLSPDLQGQELKPFMQHFFDGLHGEEHDSKRGFADALIEFLHQLGHKSEAGVVWEVAREHNLYPLAVRQKSKNHWSIDLHVMSIGTALVALSRTLVDFREAMLLTGKAPDRIEIITGWGKRSRVTGSSLVRQAVQNMLRGVGSPFFVENANLGCFVGYGKPLSQWLHQPQVEHMLLL